MVAGFESSGRRDRENSWYDAIEKALDKLVRMTQLSQC